MTDETPPPAFGQRTLTGMLAGLAFALVLALIAYPLGLFDTVDDVEASMFQIVLPLLGESTAAGVIGGVMGAVSRWWWGTSVLGTAATAGAGAAGIAAVITFGLLAATLVPVAQVTWILLLGGVVGWASFRLDQRLAS